MPVALTVLGLALGVVALLAVPVDLHGWVEREQRWRGAVSVRWLFGVVRVARQAPRSSSSPASKHPRKKGRPRARRRKRRWRRTTWRRVRAALRSPGFVRRVARLAVDTVTVVSVRSLRGWARVGLGDPADTGMLAGLFVPLSAALPGTQLRFEPDFDGAVLRVRGRGAVRIMPLRLVRAVVAFLLSPPTWRAGWAALRA